MRAQHDVDRIEAPVDRIAKAIEERIVAWEWAGSAVPTQVSTTMTVSSLRTTNVWFDNSRRPSSVKYGAVQARCRGGGR
ncbi:MAG: hypothetical protein R2710_29480 [Acidimicrobiales bacterium]